MLNRHMKNKLQYITQLSQMPTVVAVVGEQLDDPLVATTA